MRSCICVIVSRKNNIYAGTATAEVVFSGKYEGEVSADFTIVSGYVDPVTGIIIDDTFGYEVYCKVVEPDDEDLDADFNFVGESISKIYEVYLVDQSTGMRVTHKDVTVRIPCAKDDVFYHLIRNGDCLAHRLGKQFVFHQNVSYSPGQNPIYLP